MPELPEVETVRRGLLPAMQGKHIVEAEVRRADLRWPFPPSMAERLSGQQVVALRRRSKYLLADLSSGETLIWHLGMSGRVKIDGLDKDLDAPFHHALPTPEKHDHVIFRMQDGVTVTFNDARRFGAMDLFDTAQIETHPLLAKIGPEPFGNRFNEAALVAACSDRKSPIKSVLLDQRTVAGLGNIYVCEILFRARVSPLRQAGRIAGRRVAAIVPIVRDVLQEAIDAGGSSLRDHRQTNGELGYFQHNFRVYGREGLPCPTPDCGSVVRRVTQSGRSSFYCPNCQR